MAVVSPGDQTPPDLGTLARKVQALEGEVRMLRAARRLENAAVGAGGLKVVAGGRLAMETPAGARMVDIGAITSSAYNHADGSPQQATFMRREDGSAGISLFALPSGSGSTQFAAVWDASGNIVVSDDAISGMGLGRPYLPVPMWPAYDAGWATWPSTTSATMVEMWGGQFYKQHPRLAVVVRASSDASGTTGSVQLTVNGVAQGAAQSVGFGVGYYTFGPFALTDIVHMQQVLFAVTGRRTAGAGAIRATVFSAYTLQS